MSDGSNIIKELRKRRSNILKLACGGKCIICGYNKCWKALDFHHLDSNNKDFGIANYYLRKWDDLVNEAKKCIIVCKNCHTEIHDEAYTIKQLQEYFDNMVWEDSVLVDGNKNNKLRRVIETKDCNLCKRKYQTVYLNQKYCSPECSAIARRKVKSRPPIKKLLKELEKSNFLAIGKKYGVSDNCIRKWLKLRK